MGNTKSDTMATCFVRQFSSTLLLLQRPRIHSSDVSFGRHVFRSLNIALLSLLLCSIFACVYTGAAVVTPCTYLQVAVKMSFQPPARDRRRSSILTTAAAAASATRPTTTNADDKLFREFKQRLRSEGHVTNMATRELLLRNFHACAQKEATRALSGEQEDRKNDVVCRPVHTRRESGGGIVGLLTNVFSLASEVDASQDEQSASSTGNKLFGGARRSSTMSTMSTVTSYSQSTHGQPPDDNLAAVSPGIVHQCRRLSASSAGLYSHGQPPNDNHAAVSQGIVHQCRRLSEQFSTSIDNMAGVDRTAVETRRSSMPSNTAAHFNPRRVSYTGTGTIQGGDEVHGCVERRRSSLLSVFGGHRSSSMGSSHSIHGRLTSIGSTRNASIDSSAHFHMSSLRDVDEVSKEGDDHSTFSNEDNMPTAALTRGDTCMSPLNNANREFKISLATANYPLICGWSSDEDGNWSSCSDNMNSCEEKNGDAEEGALEPVVLKFTTHGNRAA